MKKLMMVIATLIVMAMAATAKEATFGMKWANLNVDVVETMWTVKKFTGKENVILTPNNRNSVAVFNTLKALETKKEIIKDNKVGQHISTVGKNANTILIVNFNDEGEIVNFGLFDVKEGE